MFLCLSIHFCLLSSEVLVDFGRDLARERDQALDHVGLVGVDRGVHALDLCLGVGLNLGCNVAAGTDIPDEK